jgi:Cu-processing system permease protein
MTASVAKLTRIHARDVLRSRWLLAYGACLFLLAEAFLRFSGSDAKAVLGLGSIALMLVPLVTLVLATVYVYGGREFSEVLLAQPVRRGALFGGLYLGLAGPMAGALLCGIGVPLAIRGFGEASVRGASITLLATSVLLTLVFAAIACCIAFLVEDRLRGISAALLAWLVLAVLYDGAVLTLVALLDGRPLERPLLALTFANPLDLARVALLLRLDVAALMGYTGAAFQRFFAGTAGSASAFAALVVWVALPVGIAAREFRRKDF